MNDVSQAAIQHSRPGVCTDPGAGASGDLCQEAGPRPGHRRPAGWLRWAVCWGVLACMQPSLAAAERTPVRVPRLLMPPVLDGDLREWRDQAYTDGLWDMDRLRQTAWYDPERNRLTDHGDEPRIVDDLQARYYLAWDDRYLYLGAEVHDNVNDVADPAHAPERWYFKDCVCWFIEAPRDTLSEQFQQGDNAFCFVADATYPPYGAWWRHGTATAAYVEEPLPASAVDYRLRLNPWGRASGDFVLEARVDMARTLGASDPDWTPPREGDVWGLEIVHTDPDGGGYGGHFLIYGTGDDDATWQRVILAGPQEALTRRPE